MKDSVKGRSVKGRSVKGRAAPSGGGRAGTIFLIFVALFVAALSTVLFVESASEHRDAARSSYTQAHGVREATQVISDDVSTGKGPDSTVTVRLSEPVDGQGTTTVHIRGAHTYSPGAAVGVVVDPQDPEYAELPGAPYTSSALWEIPLGIAVVEILVIPFGVGVVYLRKVRTRRRLSRTLVG